LDASSRRSAGGDCTKSQSDEAVGDCAAIYADAAQRDHAPRKAAMRKGDAVAYQE
jgi:hypothetical protein